MVSLRDIQLPFGKGSDPQKVRVLFLVTVFVAQTCGLQFFSIYLKHLNFSAFKVGIIRASQTWISMLLLPAWLFIIKRLQSLGWRRFVIFVFLVVNIAVHLCLTFLPSFSIIQDVTHCLTIQNKLTSTEKFFPERVNTVGDQDGSTDETPSSMSDRDKIYHSLDAFSLKPNTIIPLNTPSHKMRHLKKHYAHESKEKNVFAIRRFHRHIKQDKEFYPQERSLGKRHNSRSEASESQKGEKFSRNVIKKRITYQPVQHTIMHYDQSNKRHKSHVTPQHSSLPKTLNYNEKEETNNTQSVQGPMIANLLESEHYDNDTSSRVYRNIFTDLWNVVAINKSTDFFSTTFLITLPLAILACVFYRAIATTSYQFLLCEQTVDTSNNMPLTSPYQHVVTLVGWGVLGCPILAGIVLVSQCSYQPRVFLLFSAVLFILNLLMLLLLQLPEKCWNFKALASEYEEKKGHIPFLQR
jgi:hypothetical protein